MQIGGLTTWNKIGGGFQHRYATSTSDALYAWGDNTYGSLGDGTTVSKSSPVQVGALTGWSVLGRGNFSNTSQIIFKS